jgi:hypothetical protein
MGDTPTVLSLRRRGPRFRPWSTTLRLARSSGSATMMLVADGLTRPAWRLPPNGEPRDAVRIDSWIELRTNHVLECALLGPGTLVGWAIVIGVVITSAPAPVLGKEPLRSVAARKSKPGANGCDRNIVDPNIRTAYVSQEQAQAMVEDDGWIVRRVTICESAFPGK